MKDSLFTVRSNREIAYLMYEMRLSGPAADCMRPGTFVNLKIEGNYLRRPISVCDASENELVLLYKVVGEGTKKMAEMTEGDTIMILTGLGNGYDTSKSGDKPLLLGGGSGVAPLYQLAKRLLAEGKHPVAALGFASRRDIYYADELRALGVPVSVATVDGTEGVKGFVTDAMPADYTYTYSCGPEPMLKAIHLKSTTSGQYSFEERMGCGFGACMGCSCKTVTGYKRICRDGPVLEKEEILWPTHA